MVSTTPAADRNLTVQPQATRLPPKGRMEGDPSTSGEDQKPPSWAVPADMTRVPFTKLMTMRVWGEPPSTAEGTPRMTAVHMR